MATTVYLLPHFIFLSCVVSPTNWRSAALTPKLLDIAESPAERQLFILLVDDDRRYLNLCERYLMRSKESRFNVHTATSAGMAIELYAEYKYDCLVVDYLLPVGTGTELINILNLDDSKCTPPAIITTADGGEDAATDAIRAGAADYLCKRNVNSESLSRCLAVSLYSQRCR